MLSDLVFRLRSLFRRNTVEAELDDELRFHFEQQVEKYIRSGLTREEARMGRTARPSGRTAMVVKSGVCGNVTSLSSRVPSGANRTTSTGRSTILA